MKRLILVCLLSVTLLGCFGSNTGTFSHHKKHTDALVRDYVPTCDQPILEAARSVTQFEDCLRRDGTITVKTPDVWGDSNLMHSIQEFDGELKDSLSKFNETLQAVIVNADRAGESSQTDIAIAETSPTLADPEPSDLNVLTGKDSLTLLTSATTAGKELKLEPTERERQHATYVHLNQQLRRRAMGGDNTRKAGYGLYLFRIPVSVLPGEETSQGYSAVVNLRARMRTTSADVKYMLPRMAIADLVDALAETMLGAWDMPARAERIEMAIAKLNRNLAAVEKKYEIEVDAILKHQIDDLKKNHPGETDEEVAPRIEEINAGLKRLNLLIALRNTSQKLEAEGQPMGASAAAKIQQIIESYGSSEDFEEQANGFMATMKKATAVASATVRLAQLKKAQGGHITDVSKLGMHDWKLLEAQYGADVESPDQDQSTTIIDESLDGLENAKSVLQISSDLDAQQDFQQEMMAIGSPVEPVEPATIPVQAQSTGIAQLSRNDFSADDAADVRKWLKSQFRGRLDSRPQEHELRKILFEALLQINIHLDQLDAYSFNYHTNGYTYNAIQHAALEIERGRTSEYVGKAWRRELAGKSNNSDYTYLRTAWLLARQCGLVDLNIKRMIEEMELRGDLTKEEIACVVGLPGFEIESINFFANGDLKLATPIWQLLVEKEFPLEVFTLEPLVEEQNLVDASSRLRQMQLALAISVAEGTWNARQRVELARELARESASIGVNRTAVGFAHGNDTFGWYFHPRIQSPDTETKNTTVFSKILKTGGPTRKDDLRTYRLEPGIRECEVIIAMPSFVSEVEFDVTTNWESLANPGRSKRSYEELVQEGCKLQKMLNCLETANCGPECRPGDLERLKSRADQLGKMLGMQTHRVSVPFEYDQPATELFTQGDQDLQPQVFGYYGLKTLTAPASSDKTVIADFFLTGRNFHPTLTHVVVGGHESHSDGNDDSKVEILSRELIRVQTEITTDKFSGDNFEVRVGTPSGLSNPLSIAKFKEESPPSTASPFDWDVQPKFSAFSKEVTDGSVHVILHSENDEAEFKIKSSDANPIDIKDYRNKDLTHVAPDKGFELRIIYKATFADETERTIKGSPRLFDQNDSISRTVLLNKIQDDLKGKLSPTAPAVGKIIGTTYLRLDNWPLIKFDKTIEIELKEKP